MTTSTSTCDSRHSHPSRAEAEYCDWLQQRKDRGEIREYRMYPSVPLRAHGRPWKRWKADFLVDELDGTISYHESKAWNRADDSFTLKRDVFLLCYPEIKLFVNKALYTGSPNKARVRNWLALAQKQKKIRAAHQRRRWSK